MIPAALHKIPTQTVLSSQDVDKCILQKLLRITNEKTKNWDKKTISDHEPECPIQLQDLLSELSSSTKILSKLIWSAWLAIRFSRSKVI